MFSCLTDNFIRFKRDLKKRWRKTGRPKKDHENKHHLEDPGKKYADQKKNTMGPSWLGVQLRLRYSTNPSQHQSSYEARKVADGCGANRCLDSSKLSILFGSIQYPWDI